MENRDKLHTLLLELREEIEGKYTASNLNGKCIEASELIVSKLKKMNIKAKTVEGWCLYDIEGYGSDRSYDEHTWVELSDGTVLDITLDQFKYGVSEVIPRVYMGSLPNYLSYDKPQD